MYGLCQFLWCKYPRYGGFQADTNAMSEHTELGIDALKQLLQAGARCLQHTPAYSGQAKVTDSLANRL